MQHSYGIGGPLIDDQHDLVGGIPTPLKNMKVSWDDYSQYMEKIKSVPNHQSDDYLPLKNNDFP